MLETLYKTAKPEASVEAGEFYELVLDIEDKSGVEIHNVREIHGWFDVARKRTLHAHVTLSPEEGYATFEEAEKRYYEQRMHRARNGFRHSFAPHYFGEKEYEYEEIKV